MNRRQFPFPRPSAFMSGLVALVALLACATAGAQQVRIDAMTAILRDAVAGIGIPDGMGGVSMLVRTPKGDWFASTVPGARPDMHFRAASITKTTTAAAILLLEQRGLLRLDDSIAAPIPWLGTPYLPDTPEYAVPHRQSITIRQLLQHRAGIFDVGNDPVPASANAPYSGECYVEWTTEREPGHTFTIDELVGIAAKHQLTYGPPPAAYHYSNTGYSMLGKIIERVSGKPLDTFLYDEFTKPLGLNNTYFVVSGEDRMPRAPYIPGYSSMGSESMETTEDNASYAHAEGNMVSTFNDVATWIRALMRGEAGVTAANAARMREVVPFRAGVPVGYGLGITDHPKGLGYGHDGGIVGYLSVARHDPETDFTVVAVSTHLKFDDLLAVQNNVYRAALAIRELFK